MRTVELVALVPGVSVSDAYQRISDFPQYPLLCEAVRSVSLSEASDGRCISEWEVNFRGGILRWTEQDNFDPINRIVEFRQIEGDVAGFDGAWGFMEISSATQIRFTADLDMGIPSLADALEPIAARALIDNTMSIVNGLFGGATVVSANHRPAVIDD